MHRWGWAACGVIAAAALGLVLPGAALGASSAAKAAARSAEPAPPAPKTIRLFGAKLRYYELGAGPTLVLVHGLGSSSLGDWGAVIPTLAKTHRVLALDMLGFGGSDKPAIDYGVQTWVDFLGEFLREKRVGEFTLMGESLGGWISARYTIQALQGIAADPAFMLPKPTRLVLCDAAGHRASWQAVFTPAPAASNAPAEPIGASLAGQKLLMARIFRDPSYQSAAGVRGAFTWSLGKGDSQTIRSFVTNPQTLGETVDGQLAAITVPTLVIWGEHDELIPLADGKAYAGGIPGARLVVIPGSGHAPMIETPAAFLEALSGFR